jgi:Family of unknown function (DUF5996)
VIGLFPRSVADFYADVMRVLAEFGIEVRIHQLPNEIPDAIRFSEDHVHLSYDREYAQRFWRILVQSARVFGHFRTSFIGKCSPVHFFWGSFDLAVTRFSGRRAPLHPGGVPNLPDAVAQEAYSHEVSSAGFWPGSAGVEYPAFYSYAYPEPPLLHGANPSGASLLEQRFERVPPTIRSKRSRSFSPAPMRLPPIWGTGTAWHSNVLSASPEFLARSDTAACESFPRLVSD